MDTLKVLAEEFAGLEAKVRANGTLHFPPPLQREVSLACRRIWTSIPIAAMKLGIKLPTGTPLRLVELSMAIKQDVRWFYYSVTGVYS